MEPLLQKKPAGLAPIVGWANGSPSMSPGAVKGGGGGSPASSGLGPDSPSKTTSDDYSPALSSIGCEPVPLPSTPSEDKAEDATETTPLTPVKNGVLVPYKPSTIITNNPVYEGVKFQDDYDGEKMVRIDDEYDSICSSSYSQDDEEDEDEDEGQKGKPKVPDGGWGWVVVAASLIISMIADGISFSFGLLYIQLLEHFGESKSKTSWIGSLFMAVPLLSGPVGSALVDRYGCRSMTIIGGIISALGFVLSAFANSIEMMYMTFGVLAGLGLGLCYVTAVVSIAYWFDKKRTLATSLGACGTGIGTIVYAPMTTYFISEYGWRGTILLLAGTFLNMCVCGAVMRDPEWWTNEQNKSSSLSGGGKSLRGASSCGSISGRSGGGGDAESQFPGVDEIRRLLKSGQTPEYILTALATTIGKAEKEKAEAATEIKTEGSVTPAYSSVVNLPTFIRESETVPLEVLETLSANKRVFNVILENYPSLLLCRSLSDNGKINSLTDHAMQSRVPVTMSMRVKATSNRKAEAVAAEPLLSPLSLPPPPPAKSPARTKSFVGRQLSRTDSLIRIKKQFCTTTQPSHYLKGIRVHRNSVMYRGAMLNIHKYRLRASSCPDIYRNSMTTIAKENEEKWYSDLLDLLHGMMDFSMFLELHFLLMSLSTILLFTWFIVPYFYLADHMTLCNYKEAEASVLLSIIGITNTIGMVALGWAGDQAWMNVIKTYAVCLVMCGVSTLIMPMVTFNYALLGASTGFFGLFFASSFSFTPVILVQLIPLERFTTAYGLILLCQGIGNLLGPPIGGWIFDVTGTWDLSFYVAGIWIIVSGVLIGLIPVTTNRKIWGSGPMEKEKEAELDKVSCA